MSKTRLRVCVPYPNHGRVSDECLKGISELSKVDTLEVSVNQVQTTSIGLGRNSGVNLGVSSAVRQGGWDWDYYLSLDADIGFKAEDVIQLLSAGKDVISGAYQYRCDVSKMVAGTLNKNGVCDPSTYLDWGIIYLTPHSQRAPRKRRAGASPNGARKPTSFGGVDCGTCFISTGYGAQIRQNSRGRRTGFGENLGGRQRRRTDFAGLCI